MFRSGGLSTNEKVEIVRLASQDVNTVGEKLARDAPEGITAALKLTTLVSGDRAFAAYMQPPQELSPAVPASQTAGLFKGVSSWLA